MAVFVAYFDASGDKDDPSSRVVAVAGFVSTDSKWRKFEDDWKNALDAEGITLFHMKDFAHSKGEFSQWRGNEVRRKRFLRSLIRVIKRRTHKMFSATLFLDDYRAIDQELMVREFVGQPYAVAAQFAVIAVNLWMENHHPSDGILHVFEKGDDDQAELQHIFRTYFKHRLEVDPIFVDKKANVGVPLQAADYAAYENAKAFNDYLKTGKTRARESAVPFMPRSRDQGVRVLDRHMLSMLCRDLGVPRRGAS